MSERSEWVSWVGPARKGDLDAIDQLTQYFSPFVHAVLVSRLSHRTAAGLVKPVISQSVFRLSGLSSDAGFATWLLSAARERAADAARSPGATTDFAGDDPLINNGHLVLSKLRGLAEVSRERLVMRLLEGIAGFEIAQTIGSREADVRLELERAAATLVQQLTGEPVSFAGDSYLWSLIGTPHAAIIPLENQLTSLRYDPTSDPESTPAQTPALPPPLQSATEGRRPTGAALEPLRAEITDPSGDLLPLPWDDASEEQTAANPLPPRRAPPPANPFGTAVKTIHVSDLPAAADFAEMEDVTRPEAVEPREASNGPRPTVEMKTQVGLVAVKTRAKSVAPLEEHETKLRPSLPGGNWRSANVLGAPDPAKTIMGLPAITVPAGSVTRSWRPFGIAAALALVASGVAALLLDGTNRRVKSGWNLVPVAVAASDLTTNTLITSEMISTRFVPEAFITSSVVKPDNTAYVVNQKILVDVQAGDPLLWTQFEATRTNERLSKKVMKRARAYDITTSKAIAVGGWVKPGDHIDILTSLHGKQKGERVAVTLLQNIPVLSTGKFTTSTPSQAHKDGDKEYIDVSVLLLPEEAAIVALATEVGDLQFTLRRDDDPDLLDNKVGSSMKTLLDGERVKLLHKKRFETIQQIRNAPKP